MSAKNQISVIGHLGQDAEVRQIQSGTSIATFSLPIETGYGDRKETIWAKCEMWGKRAEGGLIQYLAKGQLVAVVGEVSLNSYENKEGVTVTNLVIKVADVALLGKKEGGTKPASQPRPTTQNSEYDGEDVPF